MQDTSLTDLAAAVGGHLDVFQEAVRIVHGPTPTEVKVAWTLDRARTATGASGGAYLTQDQTGWSVAGGDRELIMLAGEPTRAMLQRSLSDGEVVMADQGSSLLPAGVASYLGVPVPGSVAGHGVVVLVADHPGQFASEPARAVVALAESLGVALDNAAVTARLAELDLARREVVHQLQEAVRPPTPEVADTDLGVYYLAADPDVPTGGDHYDWQVLPDGDLHIAVIDIMGKGVAATKDALGLGHVLRVLVLQGCPLVDLVGRADALMSLHHPDLVATVSVARYHPQTGVLRVASGGHPPPLVAREDGTTEFLSAPGTALGWPGAGSAGEVSTVLGRADAAVFYTDGLIEARKDIIAGMADLAAAARQTLRYPATYQARALVERALAGAARRDDSLALILRRRLPPGPATRMLGPFDYHFSPNAANISLARHLFADWLRHQGADQHDIDDLLLVASELATNAVRAASGAARGVQVHAEVDGDAIVLSVIDDGERPLPDLAAIPGVEDLPRLDIETGRGLFLVRALTDELVAVAEGGRTVVRCRRRAVFPSGADTGDAPDGAG